MDLLTQNSSHNNSVEICVFCRKSFENTHSPRQFVCSHQAHVACFMFNRHEALKNNRDVTCPNCNTAIRRYTFLEPNKSKIDSLINNFLQKINSFNNDELEMHIEDSFSLNLAKALLPLYQKLRNSSQHKDLLNFLVRETLLHRIKSEQFAQLSEYITERDLLEEEVEKLHANLEGAPKSINQEAQPQHNLESSRCVVCQDDFTQDCVVRKFDCKHQIHVACYRNLSQHSSKDEKDLSCPCCRAIIKQNKIYDDNDEIRIALIVQLLNNSTTLSLTNLPFSEETLEFLLLTKQLYTNASSHNRELLNMFVSNFFLLGNLNQFNKNILLEREALDEKVNQLLTEIKFQEFISKDPSMAHREISSLKEQLEALKEKMTQEEKKNTEHCSEIDRLKQQHTALLTLYKNQHEEFIKQCRIIKDYEESKKKSINCLYRSLAITTGICSGIIANKIFGCNFKRSIGIGTSISGVALLLAEKKIREF